MPRNALKARRSAKTGIAFAVNIKTLTATHGCRMAKGRLQASVNKKALPRGARQG